MKIVYAGLLGVAQDILGIVQNIDFRKLGVELHIYGAGNQAQAIEDYCKDESKQVNYHGVVSKSEMNGILRGYDASLIPLAKSIKGAVPSKIFDIMPLRVPILYCGSGEAADIVRDYGIGLVCDSLDYEGLKRNIIEMRDMTADEKEAMCNRCTEASQTDFHYGKQMDACMEFITKIVGK